jgi:hypothetical protein
MEYEHECAEQTFARSYANALATTSSIVILKSLPYWIIEKNEK